MNITNINEQAELKQTPRSQSFFTKLLLLFILCLLTLPAVSAGTDHKIESSGDFTSISDTGCTDQNEAIKIEENGWGKLHIENFQTLEITFQAYFSTSDGPRRDLHLTVKNSDSEERDEIIMKVRMENAAGSIGDYYNGKTDHNKGAYTSEDWHAQWLNLTFTIKKTANKTDGERKKAVLKIDDYEDDFFTDFYLQTSEGKQLTERHWDTIIFSSDENHHVQIKDVVIEPNPNESSSFLPRLNILQGEKPNYTGLLIIALAGILVIKYDDIKGLFVKSHRGGRR